MNREIAALIRLTNNKSQVSCHYLIKKNGEILTLVPDLYIAWHAGKSNWGARKSLNYNSIGIEISNPVHEHGYRIFYNKQINTLIGRINQEGMTIVPTKMYFKKGKAKIQVAVGKGKKLYDKRLVKKKRDWQREKAKIFSRRNK